MAEWLECCTSKSVGPGFESHSEHLTSWICFTAFPSEFSNPSAALVNSQLVSLPPPGIPNHVMFHLQHLFQLFEWHVYKLAGLS